MLKNAYVNFFAFRSRVLSVLIEQTHRHTGTHRDTRITPTTDTHRTQTTTTHTVHTPPPHHTTPHHTTPHHTTPHTTVHTRTHHQRTRRGSGEGVRRGCGRWEERVQKVCEHGVDRVWTRCVRRSEAFLMRNNLILWSSPTHMHQNTHTHTVSLRDRETERQRGRQRDICKLHFKKKKRL